MELNWKPNYNHAKIKHPPLTQLTISTAFNAYKKLRDKLAINTYIQYNKRKGETIMGAEGGIYIYKDSAIRTYEGSGDIDKMLRCIPRHYVQELDGVKYHTFSYGDNFFNYHPFLLDDWEYEYAEKMGITMEELDKFMKWLEYTCPYEDWEVWT